MTLARWCAGLRTGFLADSREGQQRHYGEYRYGVLLVISPTAQVLLAEYDEVVERFATDRSDEPLDLARILRGCSVWPALLSLTRSCGGIEQGFGPIGAGDLAVSQGGPELAVSCATSSDG